jgi:protein gp37
MSALVDGRTTNISWTLHTFNLWWGCEHSAADDPTDPAMVDMTAISEECRNCYAESFDHRLGGEHWGRGAEPRWANEQYWRKLAQWNARAERERIRRRVFVSSMADWAQRHAVPAIDARMDELRARLMYEIGARPWLDFLLLTKRAERLAELLPWVQTGAAPPPNVWVGVTCGTRRSMWRIAKLRQIRAAVRFVSCEPLLDDITAAEWDRALGRQIDYRRSGDGTGPTPDLPPVHWLIVGDESGNGRRPTDHEWVATARDAAERNGIAFHLKQLHLDDRKVHLPVFRGRVHNAFPGGR